MTTAFLVWCTQAWNVISITRDTQLLNCHHYVTAPSPSSSNSKLSELNPRTSCSSSISLNKKPNPSKLLYLLSIVERYVTLLCRALPRYTDPTNLILLDYRLFLVAFGWLSFDNIVVHIFILVVEYSCKLMRFQVWICLKFS